MTAKQLEPLLEDALAEILNLGVGRAAASLFELVGKEVLLQVPEASILPVAEAQAVISGEVGESELSAVFMNLSGGFDGRAFLLFPDTNSLELVRAFVGEDVPLESLEDLERDALMEVGNLVLNSCLATIADSIGTGIATGLPDFCRTRVNDGLLTTTGVQDGFAVFVKVKFDIRDIQVTGFIALIMGVHSIETLKTALADFVGGLVDSADG